MKLQKYLATMLLAVTTLGFMSSCSDDDSLGDAPRLFRPVASLETNRNTIIATWDNIKGATKYDLKLFRVTGTDASGQNIYEECAAASCENIYEECAAASCESSPYTFGDLAWDEKYKVEISCTGDDKESRVYTTNDVNVPYATKLKSIKLIDNAVILNINTTLFGPSMYSGGSGSAVKTYQAGDKGSIFLNGANALVSASRSFKTNFQWTPIGNDGKTYPIDNLQELGFDENGLWSNPAGGEYRIIGNIGEDGTGDSRWLQ